VLLAVSCTIVLQVAASQLLLLPKQSEKYELRRKLQHMSTGLLFMIFHGYDLSGPKWRSCIMLCCAGSVFLIHKLRKCINAVDVLFLKAMGPLLREHETERLPGAFFFLCGCGIVTACATHKVTGLAIAFLSFGDPFASLIGMLFGDSCTALPRFGSGKSFAGMVGCWVVCSMAAWVQDMRPASSLWAGLIGSIAEAIPVYVPFLPEKYRKLDDNLTLPIISAGLLMCSVSLLGLEL